VAKREFNRRQCGSKQNFVPFKLTCQHFQCQQCQCQVDIFNLEIACLLPIKGIMQILFFIGETIGDVFLDLYLDPLVYFFAFGASQLRSQNQGSSACRRPLSL